MIATAGPAPYGPPAAPAAVADDGFVVDLPAFSGPLDLLLALIRDERLDVYDIPIARVAEQFLARIHALPLDDAADYLDLAARLVRIKAQLLLPRGADDESWEDPRAELVRRLLEYQQVREVVDHLDRLGESRRGRFARGAAPRRELPEDADAALAVGPARSAATLAELLAAVDRVLRAARAPIVHDVVARALDVPGAIGHVRALLARRAAARWSDLVARDAEPWQVLSALLALLEMAKFGEVRLAQAGAFGAVEIARGPGDVLAAPPGPMDEPARTAA